MSEGVCVVLGEWGGCWCWGVEGDPVGAGAGVGVVGGEAPFVEAIEGGGVGGVLVVGGGEGGLVGGVLEGVGGGCVGKEAGVVGSEVGEVEVVVGGGGGAGGEADGGVWPGLQGRGKEVVPMVGSCWGLGELRRCWRARVVVIWERSAR